ncbi:Uncharacterized protein FWK35_00035703, partial [Aphis craccivora]
LLKLKKTPTTSKSDEANILKGLLGLAPNGHYRVLSILQPGDLVLADKSLLISDMMLLETSLNISPFLMSPQFTSSKVLTPKSIARAKFLVEKVMRIIQSQSSIVFQLSAALVNFQNPIIKEVDHLFPFR